MIDYNSIPEEYVEELIELFNKVTVPMCNKLLIKQVIKDYDNELYNFVSQSEECYDILLDKVNGRISLNNLSEIDLYQKIFRMSEKEFVVYSDFVIINAGMTFIIKNMYDNTATIYISAEQIAEDIYKKSGKQISERISSKDTKDVEIPNEWICIGKKELLKELFNPIINQDIFPKPGGGVWASEYTPNEKFLSSWHKWCIKSHNKHFLSNNSVIFSIKSNSRIYIINNQSDLIELIDNYELSSKNDILSFQKYIDYEKVREDYDAIYLTENGLYECSDCLFLMVKGNSKYKLMCWDCSSLLILNFNIIDSQRFLKLNIFEH